MSRKPNLSKYPVTYNGHEYLVNVKYKDTSSEFWGSEYIVASIYVKVIHIFFGIKITRNKKVYSVWTGFKEAGYDYVAIAKAAVMQYEQEELTQDKEFQNAVVEWNNWNGEVR